MHIERSTQYFCLQNFVLEFFTFQIDRVNWKSIDTLELKSNTTDTDNLTLL